MAKRTDCKPRDQSISNPEIGANSGQLWHDDNDRGNDHFLLYFVCPEIIWTRQRNKRDKIENQD